MQRRQATQPPRTRGRRPPSRYERERRAQRLTWFFSIAVIAIILAIPGYGYYDAFIAPMRATVVRVNDVAFSMGYFVERLRLVQRQQQLAGERMDYSTEPFRLLDALRDDELIRQTAPRLNTLVTEDEITQALRQELTAAPKEGETPDPERLEQEFQSSYRQRLSDLKISVDEYRKITRARLLAEKMRELLSVRVPTVAEQVHLLGVLVADEAQANEVQERLGKGEEFTAVATERSLHEASKQQGGDLGWMPRGAFGPAFDEVAFKLEVAQQSEPFFWPGVTQQGTWILRLVEKAEAREVEPEDRELLKDRALLEWLEEERKANRVERSFDSKQYELAIQKIEEYRLPAASS